MRRGDRVGHGVFIVRGKFIAQVMVGVEATVGMLVGVVGDGLGTDFDVGDLLLAVAEDHIARRGHPVLFYYF